ncbi:Protein of unknown function [Bacillus mycoides]|nr:Protein of unknown function [Bacillus mycoides]
MNPKDNE